MRTLLAGKPKAIMHGQLAMLFNYMQSSLLHGNMKAGDRHMQITTTGWMMWSVITCLNRHDR